LAYVSASLGSSSSSSSVPAGARLSLTLIISQGSCGHHWKSTTFCSQKQHRPINQVLNQSIHQQTSQSVSQPVSQLVNKSVSQSFNQSIDESVISGSTLHMQQ
jgi:hypothetical protein